MNELQHDCARPVAGRNGDFVRALSRRLPLQQSHQRLQAQRAYAVIGEGGQRVALNVQVWIACKAFEAVSRFGKGCTRAAPESGVTETLICTWCECGMNE